MAESSDALESVAGESTLWKYLNFRKFVSLLERQSLYFSNPARFEDPFEGTIPVGLLNLLPTRKMKNDLADMLVKAQSAVAVDCWHLNEYESEAMWKIYSGEKGIAIQTTADRLLQSLEEATTSELRKVQYIDYNDPGVLESFDFYLPFQCKRKSFEHEREVRLITAEIEPDAPGRYCKVDTESLLQAVFVAPDSEDWFRELVGLILERYGIKRPVRRSSLSETPGA